MKSIHSLCIYLFVLQLASLGTIQAQTAPVSAPPPSKGAGPSLALSPAVVMLRGKPGQSATQTLIISNGLPTAMRFQVEVQDIVVKDGKRVYLPAGQIPSGIASSAVASPASVLVPAGQNASVSVTLTATPDSKQRAVVVYFRSQVAAAQESIGFGASLGALITFNLSDDAKVVSGPIAATPQTTSANVTFSEELENTGNEPVVPKGVVAILDERGKRVAKAAFDAHRLLPGERAMFAVASPAFLSPGRYHALSSFEYEGKVLTNAGEFTVSE